MSNYIQQSLLNKAKKDKFVFVLSFPEAMRDIMYKLPENRRDDRILPDTLQFSVHGVVLPRVSVESGVIRYAGQATKFSSHSRPEYDNITVNFTIDNEFNNYWVIWKWIDILNDDTDSIFYKGKDLKDYPAEDKQFKQYQGTATLYALDEYNKEKVRFDYTGLVPVSLGEIRYSYRDPELIESTFEFSFSKLTPTLL
jgi:hypothetical protein